MALPRRGLFAPLGVLALMLAVGGCSGEIDGGPGEGGVAAAIDDRLPPRIWRLTTPQIDAEIARLFGDGAPSIALPASADERGITNIAANAGIDEGNVSNLVDGTRTITGWVVMNGATASRCGASWGSDACVDTLLDWLPEAAYRRPVTGAEVTELRTLFTGLRAVYDFDESIRGVIRAVLLSPDFLYRTELGPSPTPSSGTQTLTGHEIATLLSYAVVDASPDDELLAAAAAGSLATADERERQVRRLMASSGRVWRRFFWEWLHMDTLRSQAVEVGLSDTLTRQMEDEYAAYIDDVVVENDGSLADVLTSTHTFVGPELAAHYGVTHPGGGLQRVELDPTERAGLLSLGAWLVAHGKRGRDNVVRRGMNVYREAMCNDIRPPDGLDVNAALARLVGPDATVRETVEIRGSAGSCANCHRLADPVGLAFETFGSDGRFQTTYPDGLPVEPAIDIPSIGTFDGATTLATGLAENRLLRHCFLRRFAHFAVGYDLGPPSRVVWLRDTTSEFTASGDQLEELLVSLVRHPAFIEREL